MTLYSIYCPGVCTIFKTNCFSKVVIDQLGWGKHVSPSSEQNEVLKSCIMWYTWGFSSLHKKKRHGSTHTRGKGAIACSVQNHLKRTHEQKHRPYNLMVVFVLLYGGWHRGHCFSCICYNFRMRGNVWVWRKHRESQGANLALQCADWLTCNCCCANREPGLSLTIHCESTQVSTPTEGKQQFLACRWVLVSTTSASCRAWEHTEDALLFLFDKYDNRLKMLNQTTDHTTSNTHMQNWTGSWPNTVWCLWFM